MFLESFSLSDYLYFDGDERPKDDDEYEGPDLPVVNNIFQVLSSDKMWY